MTAKCVFCERLAEQSNIIDESQNLAAIADGFPVTPGHSLIIPKKHIENLEQFEEQWGEELLELIGRIKQKTKVIHAPDGFNVGLNEGAAAGQTISHLHWHVIPRYEGDVPDPTGGVRGVIPNKQNYRK